MSIGYQYFCRKWYTSAQAITLLPGGTASGLQSTTQHHYWKGLLCGCKVMGLNVWDMLP